MTISQEGIDMIKRYEGLRLKAYQCSSNVWTIGYGHTSGVTPGMACTEEQAYEWLIQDIAKAERSVLALERYGYAFSQSQFDALVSFTFNCGSSNLNKLTNNGKRTLAEMADKILQYNKSNGKVLAGLTKRRQEESKMLKDNGKVVSTTYTIGPCIFNSIGTRRNYNVREEPSLSAKVIGNTSNLTVTQLISATAGFIETEHGWISREAFYDTFK